MILFSLFACSSFVLPAATQEPTLEEREALFEEFMRAPRLVRGGRAPARWLADGSSFLYRDGARSMFLDAATGVPRRATREDRQSVPRNEPTQRMNRTYAPGSPSFARAEQGSLFLGRDGDTAEQLLAEDDEENVFWSLTPEAWTQDGARFFALRTDFTPVHRLPIVDYLQAVETLDEAPYVKAGTPMARFELAIFRRDTAERVIIELGTEEEVYVFPLGWREGDAELLFLRLNREATRLDLMAGSLSTGQSRVILTDRQETFVGGLDFIVGGWRDFYTPIEGSDRFLWLSERDGWRHLYAFNYDGELLGRVTEGEFPVIRVIGVDPAANHVFFLANAEPELYDTHLYRASLAGGEFVRLTEAPGEHEIQLSPSKLYFVDTHSSPDRPPASELRDVDGGLVARLTEADVSRLEAIGWTPPERFVVKAADGETDLCGVLYRPSWFDPTQRYPVIDYIYSGPFMTVVPHDFGMTSPYANRARAMAELGFITFLVDPRGTTERGKAFQDATYGQIGELEIPDHVAALHQLAAERPWIDIDRVGIYGFSWGGYFALRAMLTAPEVFHAGVAGAPGDLTESAPINEPYMRLPTNNPKGYAAGSNPTLAANLRGPLLIMHGTADTNAPFSTSMRMVEALIQADRDFDLLVLPGATHAFSGFHGTYAAKRTYRFFLENLGR